MRCDTGWLAGPRGTEQPSTVRRRAGREQDATDVVPRPLAPLTGWDRRHQGPGSLGVWTAEGMAAAKKRISSSHSAFAVFVCLPPRARHDHKHNNNSVVNNDPYPINLDSKTNPISISPSSLQTNMPAIPEYPRKSSAATSPSSNRPHRASGPVQRAVACDWQRRPGGRSYFLLYPGSYLSFHILSPRSANRHDQPLSSPKTTTTTNGERAG
ncbi:uncharacterized protein B0H64DRAFT_84507 [Chaetomium fimeti]|uniref:Uncharacterized protein n=1 Tax=Chaetomium fimeti TaxID=1854472 RepID=A0AAE0LVH8_9PEZI|nr:hypothetical protein B0H64DRAFT_84507 [Chaetomium fimeti]